MLNIQNLQVAHGLATALWDISLHVQPGELICVVGPNAAGKTTLINAIAGLNPVQAGIMQFNEVDLCQLEPHLFCEMGVALVPESEVTTPPTSYFVGSINVTLDAVPPV